MPAQTPVQAAQGLAVWSGQLDNLNGYLATLLSDEVVTGTSAVQARLVRRTIEAIREQLDRLSSDQLARARAAAKAEGRTP